MRGLTGMTEKRHYILKITKNHRIVHLKGVSFMACNLYHNKTGGGEKKEKGKERRRGSRRNEEEEEDPEAN